jgi:hypothetical protein
MSLCLQNGAKSAGIVIVRCKMFWSLVRFKNFVLITVVVVVVGVGDISCDLPVSLSHPVT